MENFFSTYTVEIIIAVIGIGSTVLIAFLFKYVWKSDIEKIFQTNVNNFQTILFKELNNVDISKEKIFQFLEDISNFNPNVNSEFLINKDAYDQILQCHESINESFDKIQISHKYLLFLTIEQYEVIQHYLLSALACCRIIPNEQNKIFYDSKSLEFHMYYAKQIITLFDEKIDIDFKNKWIREFICTKGGIQNVMLPTKPSDIANRHSDAAHDILYYDSRDSQIWKKLNEIHDLVKSKCS